MKIAIILITILFFSIQITFGQKTSESKKPDRPIICSDCFTIQRQIFVPEVEYPKAAKAVRASGAVQVSVTIDENGNVVEAEAISGHPLLQATAVKAALQSKYKVGLIGGKPVRGYGVIVFNFNLDEPTQSEENKEKLQTIETLKTPLRVHPTPIIIGKAIKLFKPPFPANCRCKFSNNYKVAVQFIVDEKGNVESAKAVSGHPVLRQASEVAIRASKFYPSSVALEAVKASGIIVYDFVLVKKRLRSRILRYELKIK